MMYYTVYLNKNDKIVAFGDASQCAEQLKISQGVAGFRTILCRTKKGQLTKYTIVSEKVENCDTSNAQLRMWDISRDYLFNKMTNRELADKYKLSMTQIRKITTEAREYTAPLLTEWDKVCTACRQTMNTYSRQ